MNSACQSFKELFLASIECITKQLDAKYYSTVSNCHSTILKDLGLLIQRTKLKTFEAAMLANKNN